MPFMCDALLPIEERYASLKFRRLSRRFKVFRQTRDDLVEVKAMMMTPGLTREHVDVLMHWPHWFRDDMLPALDPLEDEARPFAIANAEGATEEDGRAMLVAMLDSRPNFGRYMPLYVTRYLQSRRARGATAPQLAEEFKTTPDRVMRWWRQDIFDPLTGQLRPKGSYSLGKPIHTSNRKVLGV